MLSTKATHRYIRLLPAIPTVLRTLRRHAGPARHVQVQRVRAVLTDSVTGLGNHRAFQEALRRELALAHGPTALALIDIDDFAGLNARYGYARGDGVLATLAALLREEQSTSCAFRLGGDRFGIIMSPAATLATATTAVEHLRHRVQHMLGDVSVSSGIATLLPGEGDAEMLCDRAEVALQEAKRRGQAAIVSFVQIEGGVTLPSAAKSDAVRRLLVEGRVSVVFQPIWDLGTDTILAFEALTRPAAEYGLTGPLEAFDIAEQMGRAHELDEVCRRAILQRAAELPSEALLFLNLSPQALDHGTCTGTTLVQTITGAGLSPRRVVLELTERSLARPEVVIREAQRLRALGFGLALDDVGMGNSGLEMLSQLRVDFVKIDRTIVTQALTAATTRAVLTAITTFAREAHSYVIAEGIETAAMLTMAQRMDVHGAQGYLLGQPSMDVPALKALPHALPA